MADDNAVYLFYGAIQAFIIPLRVFANDDEQNEFLNFIKGKISRNNMYNKQKGEGNDV